MDALLVKPGSKVNLRKIDPADESGFKKGKEKALQRLKMLTQKLESLQEVLYGQHRHKILMILQAMDTGGKDGVVRHVFEGVNPQGVRVVSFKVPTQEEQDHDYLWRAHKQTPAKGEIVVFNRSYYEDVLIVRVHELVEKHVWEKRFDHINDFERMLTDEGTTILKFFLHIGLDEQKKRLQARLDDPAKNWKFNIGDLSERKRWDDYMEAYEEALGKTSTSWAPWRVIPANRKWYRNLMICETLVRTLEKLHPQYPKADFDPKEIHVE